MILSHAHIDHSGNIPNLVKQGFRGKIYSTDASEDLADIMLRDSGHIQENDIKYVNKKRRKKGERSLEPIYTQRDAIDAIPYFQSVWYQQKFEPIPGITAQLVDAGHIWVRLLSSWITEMIREKPNAFGSQAILAGMTPPFSATRFCQWGWTRF